MSDTNEASGIFDAIDIEVTAHDPIEEVNTEPVAEGSEASSSSDEIQEVTKTEEAPAEGEATSVEGQANTDTEKTESQEHLQNEESTEAEVENWEATLPPAPLPYQGPVPEVDPETGQISNMGPEEYAQYTRETLKAELRQEAYQSTYENAALNAAEKILPEIKTNQFVRQMVENARIASVLNGQQISSVEAAKQVREALGIAPEKLTQAKNEGAQNAKVSIEVQKSAALGSSSSQVPSEDPTNDLVKRIQRGDDDAFTSLLSMWEDEGKI